MGDNARASDKPKSKHGKPQKQRPPSTFGSTRPEPRTRMLEGLVHPQQDALVYDRLYNYRQPASSRLYIPTYTLDGRTHQTALVPAIGTSVTQPQVPPTLHYRYDFNGTTTSMVLPSFSRTATSTVGSSVARSTTPTATTRRFNGAGGGLVATPINSSSQTSSTANSNKASFSASTVIPQRTGTPTMCRTPNITAGKFHDVATPRRSGTPVISRGVPGQSCTSGWPDETRIIFNSECVGGVTPGSWKETQKWVLALRNPGVQFKKRPLPKVKPAAAAADENAPPAAA